MAREMASGRRRLPAAFLALLAAAGTAALVGCGGAGGPAWSTGGPSYNSGYGGGGVGSPGAPGSPRSAVPPPTGVVRGVVEMPVRPSGLSRPVAFLRWLRLGSPAHAEASVARQPVAGARVHLADRGTRQPVSATVTTNERGEFRVEGVTPSNRFSAIASDGRATLEAVVPTLEAGRLEAQVTINEATTIGAAAARLAEEEGLGPEDGVLLAQRIAERQERLQEERPAELPDLTRADEPTDRARQHLLRGADAFVGAALETKERPAAACAVGAAQLLARSQLKLSRRVRLTPAQVEALVAAMLDADARAASADKIAVALRKAGVKPRGEKEVTAEHVGAALGPLRKVFPSLKKAEPAKVPVLAALILAEQAGGPFQITTREQMRSFLKELVGEVEGPREPAKGKPTAAAAKKGKANGNSGAPAPAPAAGKDEEQSPPPPADVVDGDPEAG
ncbi:MAG: carboxypeptidase regulatory-like domain-containing protein [Armatimonadetes bacterium]|nr:carboxypeptidase regulatory-like domain-containing protein [Armatimonadota bacterium]